MTTVVVVMVAVCWLAGFADRLHSDTPRPHGWLVRSIHAVAIAVFLPVMGAVYVGDWCGRLITGGER